MKYIHIYDIMNLSLDYWTCDICENSGMIKY